MLLTVCPGGTTNSEWTIPLLSKKENVPCAIQPSARVIFKDPCLITCYYIVQKTRVLFTTLHKFFTNSHTIVFLIVIKNIWEQVLHTLFPSANLRSEFINLLLQGFLHHEFDGTSKQGFMLLHYLTLWELRAKSPKWQELSATSCRVRK